MPKVAKTFNGNLEQALNASAEHLYIANNLKGAHAILLLEIKDTSGKPIGLRLPKTWVPIDLMLFADRESLRKSNSLRKLHRMGAIRFLDPTSADEVMSTKEAREEAKRSGILGELDFDPSEMTEDEAKAAENVLEVVTESEDDPMSYYRNVLATVVASTDEDDIIRQIKDLKSSYFADSEIVNSEVLVGLLQEAKTKLDEAGLSASAAEVDSMIDAINE